MDQTVNRKQTQFYASIPIDERIDLTRYLDKQDLLPSTTNHEQQQHVSVHVMFPEQKWSGLSATIKAACKTSFAIHLKGLGFFSNPDKDVLYFKVQLGDAKEDQLVQLHQLLVKETGVKYIRDQYTPHVTIAYLKPNTAAKYIKSIKFDEQIVQATKIEFRQHGGLNELAHCVQLPDASTSNSQRNKTAKEVG